MLYFEQRGARIKTLGHVKENTCFLSFSSEASSAPEDFVLLHRTKSHVQRNDASQIFLFWSMSVVLQHSFVRDFRC